MTRCFCPRLAGWYERDLTLMFVGEADLGPLSGARRGGREPTLMFVGRSNRETIGRACWGRNSPSSLMSQPLISGLLA